MSRRLTRSQNATESLSVSHVNTSSSNQHAQHTAMYMNSQYNHPAFNKLCLGSNSAKGYPGSNAVPKAPKAPEKPLMPYMRYSRKVWEEVKTGQPDLKLWEIGKIIGKKWRELPAPEKQVIMDEYESEKIEYQEMMRAYHNSPAYQNYLQAKGRAEMNESLENQIEREDAYLSIETANDEPDGDDGLSNKHISAARFQRNQRLMHEILADSNVVQSGRSVVTSKRLKTLCMQVESLEHHHGKLKIELEELEKKHVFTKRKWQEDKITFEQEIKKLKATPEVYSREMKLKNQKVESSQASKSSGDKQVGNQVIPASNTKEPSSGKIENGSSKKENSSMLKTDEKRSDDETKAENNMDYSSTNAVSKSK